MRTVVLLINIDIRHNMLDAVIFMNIFTVHFKIEAIGEVKFVLLICNVGISLSMASSLLFSWSNL